MSARDGWEPDGTHEDDEGRAIASVWLTGDPKDYATCKRAQAGARRAILARLVEREQQHGETVADARRRVSAVLRIECIRHEGGEDGSRPFMQWREVAD